MMTGALVKAETQVERVGELDAKLMESVLLQGDLAKLAPDHRVRYYDAVCKSIGLNPLTRPFEYVVLQGKTTLYAKRECTEQLRKIHGVSIQITDRSLLDDVYVVTARAFDNNGRQDESTGAVNIGGLKGEARANALMKAETKAKRRVTLSICGLAFLDESEEVPGAAKLVVDHSTGEIVGQDGGSKEAAQEVATAKIRQLKAVEVVEPQPEPEPEKPKTFEFKQMIDGFALMRKEIGDEAYYRILGTNGYEHCNQITKAVEARRIYKEMATARQAQQEIAQ